MPRSHFHVDAVNRASRSLRASLRAQGTLATVSLATSCCLVVLWAGGYGLSVVLPVAVERAFDKVVSLPGVSSIWMAGASVFRLVAGVIAGGARTLNPFEGAGDALRLQPVKVGERLREGDSVRLLFYVCCWWSFKWWLLAKRLMHRVERTAVVPRADSGCTRWNGCFFFSSLLSPFSCVVNLFTYLFPLPCIPSMYAASVRRLCLNCTLFIRSLTLNGLPHSTLLPLAGKSVFFFTFLKPRCTGTSRVPATYARYAALRSVLPIASWHMRSSPSVTPYR